MLTESYKMAGRTDKEGVIKALEREIAKAAGTQFTGFTSIYVQTDKEGVIKALEREIAKAAGTQFTGFTSIKVQILTPAARRARGVAHAGRD
jgi:hypothetical protein